MPMNHRAHQARRRLRGRPARGDAAPSRGAGVRRVLRRARRGGGHGRHRLDRDVPDHVRRVGPVRGHLGARGGRDRGRRDRRRRAAEHALRADGAVRRERVPRRQATATAGGAAAGGRELGARAARREVRPAHHARGRPGPVRGLERRHGDRRGGGRLARRPGHARPGRGLPGAVPGAAGAAGARPHRAGRGAGGRRHRAGVDPAHPGGHPGDRRDGGVPGGWGARRLRA